MYSFDRINQPTSRVSEETNQSGIGSSSGHTDPNGRAWTTRVHATLLTTGLFFVLVTGFRARQLYNLAPGGNGPILSIC